MLKILRHILPYTPLLIILIIVACKRTNFNIDTIITILTLIGLIIDRIPEKRIQEKIKKIVDEISKNIFSKFGEKPGWYIGIFITIISILSIIFSFFANDSKIWQAYLVISIGGFILIFYTIIQEDYFHSENNLEKTKDKDPYFIYYCYLFCIYMLFKFTF